MFKSQASKYNIVDFTPYGKDVLDTLAKACRKQGIKLGFYYSDTRLEQPRWNNRPTPHEPRMASSQSRGDRCLHTSTQGSWDPLQQTATRKEYFDRVAIPQIKELLTNYGDIAVFFWDTPSEMTEEYAGKNQRPLQ